MSATGGRQAVAGVAWASLGAFTLVYLLLFALGALPVEHVLFPFLGRTASWILTVWAAFALLLVALELRTRATADVGVAEETASLGPFRPSRLIRRTGLARTDWACLACAVVVAAAGARSLFWFPVASLWVAVLLFVVLRVPVEKWPTRRPGRAIPSIPGQPPERGSDGVERSWTWKTLGRGDVAAVTLWLRRKQFQEREAENPSHVGVPASLDSLVAELVTRGSEDVEVVEAARQLLDHARSRRYDYFEEAQNTLQFVQAIPYRTDEETKGKEYFRFGLETLFENAGDCDCKAILAASLFRLMGLRSVVLVSWAEEHAAVAVEGAPDFPGNAYFDWNGAKYNFCETTDGSFGFTVGEVPPNVDLTTYRNRIEIEPKLMGRDAGEAAATLPR